MSDENGASDYERLELRYEPLEGETARLTITGHEAAVFVARELILGFMMQEADAHIVEAHDGEGNSLLPEKFDPLSTGDDPVES